jgi:hypothetical protein
LVKGFQTAPILPVDSNPHVATNKEFIGFLLSAFFSDASENEQTKLSGHIEAGFSAVYQERKPGNEIGVYALLFCTERKAKEAEKECQKEFAVDPNPTVRLVRKGRFLLLIWCDEGVTASVFTKMCDYFRKTELRNTTKR